MRKGQTKATAFTKQPIAPLCDNGFQTSYGLKNDGIRKLKVIETAEKLKICQK
jgi:hypothetical protein